MAEQRPDWIKRLDEECRRTSQKAVGQRIGYSPSVVNQVLKGTYAGNLNRVQARVEGAFMGATVDCPVIGELARNRCEEYQRRKPAATNPLRVQLAIACRTCPHRRH